MLQYRLSAIFFISCLVIFMVGAIFTLPPNTDKWELKASGIQEVARGETTTSLEKQIEDKLSYKEWATDLWGTLRYKIFNTGTSGVVIGKDGWLFTKEEFETTDNFAQIAQDNTARMQKHIASLRAHGITPVVAWIPSKTRHHADKLGKHQPPAMHQSLAAPQGMPLIDGSAVFANMKQPAFMRTDTHWSAYGAHAMATAVKNYITTNHPELELTSKSFLTKQTTDTDKPYRGDLLDFIPTMESVKPEGEAINRYVTEANSEELSDDLFGEEVIDVTLIGTSYSAQEDWHFEGFLKQALQTDVLNLADEGQGPFAPMETFIKNLPSLSAKPKLVIWEFPERYLPRKDKTEGAE